MSKIGKLNLKGSTGKVIGLAAGGAASAVFDRYVSPSLEKEDGTYKFDPNYVKIAAGVVVPMFVKSASNGIIGGACDGLVTVGVANLVSGFLGSPKTSGIGARRFKNYAKRVRVAGGDPSFNAVGKSDDTESAIGDSPVF
jgi:hypothetical protein